MNIYNIPDNSNFQEIENIEKLIIDKENLVVPYIAVYAKTKEQDIHIYMN